MHTTCYTYKLPESHLLFSQCTETVNFSNFMVSYWVNFRRCIYSCINSWWWSKDGRPGEVWLSCNGRLKKYTKLIERYLKFITLTNNTVIKQQFVLGINCSIFLYRNFFGANQRLALTRKSFRSAQVSRFAIQQDFQVANVLQWGDSHYACSVYRFTVCCVCWIIICWIHSYWVGVLCMLDHYLLNSQLLGRPMFCKDGDLNRFLQTNNSFANKNHRYQKNTFDDSERNISGRLELLVIFCEHLCCPRYTNPDSCTRRDSAI